jgi:drug/metabolite transporter (DMT)-like permease
MYYFLLPIIAALLATAQATWASLFKTKDIFDAPLLQIINTVITDYRVWIGGLLYIVATLCYFLALNKINFFVLQFTVTGLVIALSVIFSVFFFHEKISLVNIIGAIIILVGAGLVIGYK